MHNKPIDLKKISFLLFLGVFLVCGNIFAQDTAKEAFAKGTECCKTGKYDEAIINLSRAIELNVNYMDAYSNRGVAYYYGKGNADQAISDFSKAIELNPKHAMAYNNRGTAYAYKGNLDQAISDFSKAIELNSNYAEAYNNRSVAYLTKKEYAKSEIDARKAKTLRGLLKQPSSGTTKKVQP